MRGYLRNVCFIIGSLSSASYDERHKHKLVNRTFSGNFNGNFIELKCTTLFFAGKTKQKNPRRAVYQFHVVCFDGNGCA